MKYRGDKKMEKALGWSLMQGLQRNILHCSCLANGLQEYFEGKKHRIYEMLELIARAFDLIGFPS